MMKMKRKNNTNKTKKTATIKMKKYLNKTNSFKTKKLSKASVVGNLCVCVCVLSLPPSTTLVQQEQLAGGPADDQHVV